MAGAVEAVAADAVLICQVVGDCVAPCFFRHGGVERGVEDSNLRQGGPLVHCCAHALNVCGVVQRCQRGEVVDLLDNFLSQQGGVGELLCTLHHAVADCLQLTACQDGLKLLRHDVECDFVVGHVGADVFNEAGGQHLLCFGQGGVTHLVLQGGRTGVHNENKHESISFVVFFSFHSRTFRACVRDGPDRVFNGGFYRGRYQGIIGGRRGGCAQCGAVLVQKCHRRIGPGYRFGPIDSHFVLDSSWRKT